MSSGKHGLGESVGALCLGLDVGSVHARAALVERGGEGRVVALAAERISSGPAPAVDRLLDRIAAVADLDLVEGAGLTGSGRELYAGAASWQVYSSPYAAIAGLLADRPDTRTIVQIGGQSAFVVGLEGGIDKPWRVSRSPLCAAGTGRFLEQQAHRLGHPRRGLRSAGAGMDERAAADRRSLQRLRQVRPHPPPAEGLAGERDARRALRQRRPDDPIAMARRLRLADRLRRGRRCEPRGRPRARSDVRRPGRGSRRLCLPRGHRLCSAGRIGALAAGVAAPAEGVALDDLLRRPAAGAVDPLEWLAPGDAEPSPRRPTATSAWTSARRARRRQWSTRAGGSSRSPT